MFEAAKSRRIALFMEDTAFGPTTFVAVAVPECHKTNSCFHRHVLATGNAHFTEGAASIGAADCAPAMRSGYEPGRDDERPGQSSDSRGIIDELSPRGRTQHAGLKTSDPLSGGPRTA